jgi:hypothetical protein
MSPSFSVRLFALTCAVTIALSIADVIAEGFLGMTASDTSRAVMASCSHGAPPGSAAAQELGAPTV